VVQVTANGTASRGGWACKEILPLVAIEEAHRILDEISAKNGHDVIRVATNFAHKVGPFVEQLERAMQALEMGRELDRSESELRRADRAGNAG